MVTEGDERGEEVEEDVRLYGIYPLPYSVGYAIWAGGRRGGALAQGLLYLFQGEGGGIGVWGEPSSGWGRGLGRKEVLEERVVYGGRGIGTWERREAWGLSRGHVLFGGPDVLGGGSGQEVRPVRAFGAFDCFEVAQL